MTLVFLSKLGLGRNSTTDREKDRAKNMKQEAEKDTKEVVGRRRLKRAKTPTVAMVI